MGSVDLQEAIRLWNEGYSTQAIAQEFNVTKGYIDRMLLLAVEESVSSVIERQVHAFRKRGFYTLDIAAIVNRPPEAIIPIIAKTDLGRVASQKRLSIMVAQMLRMRLSLKEIGDYLEISPFRVTHIMASIHRFCDRKKAA